MRPRPPVSGPGGDPDRQRDAALQRVRVGLTGLAAVFLLTLLAASILALLGQNDRGARNPRAAGNATGQEGPREPLAELGVAPGNAPRTPDSPARPAPAAAPATVAPPRR